MQLVVGMVIPLVRVVANSSRLRERLKKKLGLPEHLGTNALVGVLGCILSYEEFLKLAAEIRAEDESAADPAR